MGSKIILLALLTKNLRFMRNLRSQTEVLPVRGLLTLLSWLTTKRGLSDPAIRSAIVHHFHLLVLHPASDSIDIQAGIYMARKAGMDAGGLLARYAGTATSLH